MSFIYEDIELDLKGLKTIGYFQPKIKDFKTIVPNCNHNYHFSNKRPITSKTLIVYYPGAFSYMHLGHLSLIKKAFNTLISDDVRVVIAPANSDYLYNKYGSNINVTNVQRFNRIVDFIETHRGLLDDIIEDIIIDMNPMLNMTCDYNFTDLLKNFIDVSGLDYNEIPTPYILCGKDREYFKELTKYTDRLKVFYDEGDDISSCNFIDDMKTVTRKDVLVRVNTLEQFNIFKKYMYPFYNTINMSLISEEIEKINIYLSETSETSLYTNCKDYESKSLKYVPISRKFEHPLDINPTISCTEFIESKSIFIDSDVFSGTTKRFIESFNRSRMVRIINYSE